jgi:hypothetical protein
MISATLILKHPQLYNPDEIWKGKKGKNRKELVNVLKLSVPTPTGQTTTRTTLSTPIVGYDAVFIANARCGLTSTLVIVS